MSNSTPGASPACWGSSPSLIKLFLMGSRSTLTLTFTWESVFYGGDLSTLSTKSSGDLRESSRACASSKMAGSGLKFAPASRSLSSPSFLSSRLIYLEVIRLMSKTLSFLVSGDLSSSTHSITCSDYCCGEVESITIDGLGFGFLLVFSSSNSTLSSRLVGYTSRLGETDLRLTSMNVFLFFAVRSEVLALSVLLSWLGTEISTVGVFLSSMRGIPNFSSSSEECGSRLETIGSGDLWSLDGMTGLSTRICSIFSLFFRVVSINLASTVILFFFRARVRAITILSDLFALVSSVTTRTVIFIRI